MRDKVSFKMSTTKYASRFKDAFLCTNSKVPKMIITEVAKYLQRSKYCLRTWLNRYEYDQNVDDLLERDCTKNFSRKQVSRIKEIFINNPSLTLRAGKKKLIYVSL